MRVQFLEQFFGFGFFFGETNEFHILFGILLQLDDSFTQDS